MAIDLALSVGKGDYTAFAIGQLDADRRLHVVHVERHRAGLDETIDLLFQLYSRYEPQDVLIDDDNASKVFRMAVFERARRIGRPVPLNALPMRGKDKETRAAALRGLFLQGDVRLLRAPWTDALVRELLEFPAGDHDDQVDALGLIARRLPVLASPLKPPQPVRTAPLRVVPHLQSDGTTRYVLGMGLNEMFEELRLPHIGATVCRGRFGECCVVALGSFFVVC